MYVDALVESFSCAPFLRECVRPRACVCVFLHLTAGFDSRWAAHAIYALVILVGFVVGLPLAILLILFRRRRSLFGPSLAAAANTARLGFLYSAYGPTAWWWEIEELMRKLLLTAIAVLLDAGSPLQVRGREYLRAPSL